MVDTLPSLSLFYPMHNEEGNIEEAVRRALEILPRVSDRFEVIIVNDGSTDRTGRLLQQLTERHEKVRAVTHEHNQGYGAALVSGIRHARYEYIFYTDGDNQFDIAELNKLVPLLAEADIIAGYRRQRNDPWLRTLNAEIFRMAVRIVFGLALRDVDCAFKLFRASIFEKMPLVSQGAMIDTEILARARKKGFRIAEVPVNHYPRTSGEQSGASLKVILRAMKEFVRLWWLVLRAPRS